MRSKFDISKANAVIDEYLRELADKNKIPGRLGRTWMEFCMQRNGMIPDVRRLALGESHALWYAALVITGRVREVTRAERAAFPGHVSKTETTIRRCLNPRCMTFSNHTAALLREILQANEVAA